MGNKGDKEKRDKTLEKSGDKPTKKSSKKIKPIQCVVLGIAASGKSTFTRQLRVIHGISFTQAELENLKKIIRNNVITGIHEVSVLVSKRNLQLQEHNIKHARFLDTLTKETNLDEVWKDEKFVPKLESLWQDPAMANAWESSDATLSNLGYFMKKIDVVSAEAYLPDHDDVFRARQRTAGAATTEFVANKHHWSFKDAGGQPYERKNWPQIIAAGLHAIMFFVALDEYDSPSDSGEPNTTKMQDSLEAWKDLFELSSVKSSCVLLFLNKVDLFTIKWNKDTTSFRKIFSEDATNAKTVEDGIGVISNYFLSNIAEEFANKVFVAHVTALDTSIVTTVFHQVRLHVIRARMADTGMRL